jgi:hypothetical protein
VIPYVQHFKVKVITLSACQKYASNFEKKNVWLLYDVLLILRKFLKFKGKMFGEKCSKNNKLICNSTYHNISLAGLYSLNQPIKLMEQEFYRET